MTTDTESMGSRRERTIMYSVVAITFAILLVIVLIAYSSAASNSRAEAKADQLIAALEQAGVAHPPTRERIVRVLGEDGGAICADPNSALARATLLSQLAPMISTPATWQSNRRRGQALCPVSLPSRQTSVGRSAEYAPRVWRESRPSVIRRCRRHP
ncbi:hypothetical protein ACFVAV_31525 [Nocardia sp. NPDC057663]|uniref:hypothetical protein n=1 Tax=Nocardia sp. NPDC057663 TaxID=3346201 RepID=UPI00366BE48C